VVNSLHKQLDTALYYAQRMKTETSGTRQQFYSTRYSQACTALSDASKQYVRDVEAWKRAKDKEDRTRPPPSAFEVSLLQLNVSTRLCGVVEALYDIVRASVSSVRPSSLPLAVVRFFPRCRFS
jgi:hypothetical protein